MVYYLSYYRLSHPSCRRAVHVSPFLFFCAIPRKPLSFKDACCLASQAFCLIPDTPYEELHMKKQWISVGIALCVVAGSSVYREAEGSWLDKINIFKKDSGESTEVAEGAPSTGEIGDAFKEALRMGTESVVGQLGTADGFNGDPAIHIPLPPELQAVKSMLDKAGMGHLVDDLELKLNRGAEAATPKAKSLFMDAIAEMTFEDVKQIYDGPENSATLYFQEKMTPSLKKEMAPVVDQTLSEVGAIQAYDKVMDQYKTMPYVPDVKADLTDYVLDKGVDGIFHYIAIEEAEIRKDPVKQTTALLKKVFGE